MNSDSNKLDIPNWIDIHTIIFDFDGIFTNNKVFVRDDLLKWLKEIHYHTKKIYMDISINENLGYEYQYQNFGLVKDQLLNLSLIHISEPTRL